MSLLLNSPTPKHFSPPTCTASPKSPTASPNPFLSKKKAAIFSTVVDDDVLVRGRVLVLAFHPLVPHSKRAVPASPWHTKIESQMKKCLPLYCTAPLLHCSVGGGKGVQVAKNEQCRAEVFQNGKNRLPFCRQNFPCGRMKNQKRNTSTTTVVEKETLTGTFNPDIALPFQLRVDDFKMAMQDVHDFFSDVNTTLKNKGLSRLDDMLRPAIMSGVLSDMLTASLAKHSRSLVENGYFNGHPDLIVKGVYSNNKTQSGSEGVEIKTTRKEGGAVDMHGAREQYLCVFVYTIDNETEPATNRRQMRFTEVYLGKVSLNDFRKNERGELGTRTATLHKEGIAKLRKNWVYRV
ncbi:MAG: hypothetical protein LBT53_10360 [Puniceicoccales bacterium]|nr:hypothetical protein [Puniceicoccales bacterium]